MADKFKFDRVLEKLKKVELSLDLANIAKTEFLNNFKNQGFDGVGWKDVKRRTNPTKSDIKNGGSTRSILIGKGSGRLRRDVANSVTTGRKNSNLSYTLVVQNDYASIHNNGGIINKSASGKTTTGRTRFAKKGHNIVIPKRQFVGTTDSLNRKMLAKIESKLKKIWEN